VLTKIEVKGLRGFATTQTLQFAQPNGTLGSGLTVIVGSNNAGKSTVLEGLRAVAQKQEVSLTHGRRNHDAGDEVAITLFGSDGRSTTLSSIKPGTSETKRLEVGGGVPTEDLLVLQARRTFEPYFSRNNGKRNIYVARIGFPPRRTASLDQFTSRLFEIQKDSAKFNELMARVLPEAPDWTIDQDDNGNFFLKVNKGGGSHSSEGMGEGLVSLMYIIDALYDSEAGHAIAIDEPELSLHPALQRKLCNLLKEFSASRQIVLSTHSPYFTTLDSLANGATLARVHLDGGASIISQLTAKVAQRMNNLLGNLNNPHILGLNAQEVFFVEDGVILVEGQEDVIFYDRVLKDLGIELDGTFYGWGVGGADNIGIIANMLNDLGFKRVAGILDGNKKHLVTDLQNQFPDFLFASIPANDVRTKPATPARDVVAGLLDDGNKHVREELKKEASEVLESVRLFLAVPDKSTAPEPTAPAA
jgi:predicted ATPase